MSAFEVNKNIWSNIYESGRSNLLYPNETLVRYTAILFANKKIEDLKLLDYGFGSGNNLLHFSRMGFDVFGTEVSQKAKEITLEKIKNIGLPFDKDKLKIVRQNGEIPFEDNFFDVITPWLVLHYNTLEDLKMVLENIYKKLKPGGKFLTTMIKPNDIGVENSTQVSEFERVMKSELGNQTGSKITVLNNESDIKNIFNKFHNIQIGYYETYILNRSGAHWIIYGEKEHE